MIVNFIEYMWYLLTTPLKKLKKALNKWYILCRVFGRRFDEVKEDILRARDEGMVATCSHEMLPVHGADRRLSRYEGEHLENYRSRIAMYEEICKLGGTNEGIILAVKALGYRNPVIKPARDFKSDDNRWAEFYLIIIMGVDEEHPIKFDILRKNVRMWKEVGAKDCYYMGYKLILIEGFYVRFWVSYRYRLNYFDYFMLDGKWLLDGSKFLDAARLNYYVRCSFNIILCMVQFIRVLQGIVYMLQVCLRGLTRNEFSFRLNLYSLSCLTPLNMVYMKGQRYSLEIGYKNELNLTWHEEHSLKYFDGTWNLDGTNLLDAFKKTEVL